MRRIHTYMVRRVTVPSREVPGTLGLEIVDVQDGCRLVKVVMVKEGSPLDKVRRRLARLRKRVV